jgi:hypothetical protein
MKKCKLQKAKHLFSSWSIEATKKLYPVVRSTFKTEEKWFLDSFVVKGKFGVYAVAFTFAAYL